MADQLEVQEFFLKAEQFTINLFKSEDMFLFQVHPRKAEKIKIKWKIMELAKDLGIIVNPSEMSWMLTQFSSTNYASVSSNVLQGNRVPYDSLGHFLYNVVLCHAFFKMKTNYASLPVFWMNFQKNV